MGCISDAILVNATLNCVSILMRTRPSIANKIVESILNFNPLKAKNSPMTPTLRVKIKSMERTTRAVLINLLKKWVNTRDIVETSS
jgi:symplekin